MKKPIKTIASGLILLFTVVVPALGMAYGASSMAAGVLLVAVLHGLLFTASSALHKSRHYFSKIIFFVTVVLAVVLMQGVISLLVNASSNKSRFLLSIGLLIIYLLGASFLALLVKGLPKYMGNFAVKLVFYVLMLSGFATVLGYRAFGNPSGVGFFNENSHYALSFGPFLLYLVVLSNLRTKFILLCIGFIIALSLQSLTLLVSVIVIVFFVLRLRYLLPITIIIISVLVTFDALDFNYYTSRLDLFEATTNLSALSYTNGWERAYLNLIDFDGFGIGFQQLGFVGSEGESRESLRMYNVEDVNLYDGSFVASKFISEFGVVAILLLLRYLIYCAKYVVWLHNVSLNGKEAVDCRTVFFLSCFVMFFTDLFFRGTGYFSSSGFLFVASLVWIKLTPIFQISLSNKVSNDSLVINKCLVITK